MIGSNFVRAANPLWYYVDLQGAPFNDNFYMWVLSNEIPYVPVSVFHDDTGITPWTDPIQFLSNGTLPIDIFWDDTQVYRLEFRQNNGIAPPSQNDTLIYLVENFIPSGTGISPNTPGNSMTTNQITNGQFSIVNFPAAIGNEYSLIGATNPPSVEIAPNWFIDLVGTGGIIVQQVPLGTNIPNPTNAPYYLELDATGTWSSAILRQRFYENGQNWQGKYVSVSMTGFTSTSPFNVIVLLVASNGTTVTTLMNQTFSTAVTQYTNSVLIPSFINLNTPPNAYLDFKILLPVNQSLFITSIQLIVSDTNSAYDYEEDTINRQIDHTFHYYRPKLNYKNTESYLKGWDFPLNPAQPLGDTVANLGVPTPSAGANQAAYVWDQTIIYQTLNNAVGVSRGADGSLVLTALTNPAGQICVIQYLEQTIARKILADKNSVNIHASTTAAAGFLQGSVSLWATTNGSPFVPALPATFFSTVDSKGNPTSPIAGWTQVPNIYQNNGFELLPASATNSESADIQLNGWDMQNAAPTNTATSFAIVVGFSSWAVGDTITLNSISLCPGDIPTRPQPKSVSETLLDCQRYYWSTFPQGTAPQTALGIDTGEYLFTSPYTGAKNNITPSLFFPVKMRVTPSITYYNPVSANNFSRNEAANSDASSTTTAGGMVNSSQLSFLSAGIIGWTTGDIIGTHLKVEARLGIV